MAYFLSFWYLESFSRFYGSFGRGIQELEGTFAVRDTARNLDKPLFQDYTRQGRIIGFMIRLARIFMGLLFYLFFSVSYFVLYLFWLLFPLLCLAILFGSLLGPVSGNL